MCSVGLEFVHAEGQTYRQTDRQTKKTKLIVAPRNFEKAPKRVTPPLFSLKSDTVIIQSSRNQFVR